MPKKPINLRIDGQLLERLKNLAEESRTSLTHIIESFCQYGLQQDIEISKDSIFINVNTIDESQIQQKIQKFVDTAVEAKVKTILADINTNVDTKVKTLEDRLDAALKERLEQYSLTDDEDIERILERKVDELYQFQFKSFNQRLEVLEQKTQPLSEQDFKTLNKAIKKKPEQEQSNEDASKMAIERSDDKSPQQEEKERLQDNFVGEPEPNAEEAGENRERLSSLNTEQLRELCKEYGLKWSHAHGKNKHLKKAEMIKAILKRLNC